MRTTVDINDALMRDLSSRALVERRPFKAVLGEVLALGLGRATGTLPVWTCSTHDFGAPQADYTKAWALIDEFDAISFTENRERGR